MSMENIQSNMHERLRQLVSQSPGLKAKAIARQLGQQRSDINALLHKYNKDFVQDEDFCWHVSEQADHLIEFQPGWTDASMFEKSLKDFGSPLDCEINTLKFSIPSGCKLLLEAGVRLLALCNQLSSSGKNVVVDFSDCKSTLSYFDRIGFFEHLNEQVTVLPRRPVTSKAYLFRGNSSAMVEFGAITIGVGYKDLVNRLSNIFVLQSNERYEVAASTVFSELIGNINDHSRASVPGFAALQKYNGRRTHIQTVVSDSGDGIAATLKPTVGENYPQLANLSDMELVKEVLMKGEISRHGAGNGLGFKSSREQTIKFNARLSVRQVNFSFTVEYKNGSISDMRENSELARIDGTHVCFDFFVD